MTPEEFEYACRLVCQRCADGLTARYRPATREWVHDLVKGTPQRHSRQNVMCRANGLRNSSLAKEAANG